MKALAQSLPLLTEQQPSIVCRVALELTSPASVSALPLLAVSLRDALASLHLSFLSVKWA